MQQAYRPSTLPFLKWPGGKRWIAPEIAAMISGSKPKRYLEPFLGGGAVFFSLRPTRAILADINADLIGTYSAVKDEYPRIIRYLKKMEVSRGAYDQFRSSRPRGRFAKAARFLYLNRTAFGGIYRLNQNGEYNVPYGGGRTPDILWERGLLRSAAESLQSAELLISDFQSLLDGAGREDFVYCDPTYTVAHENNGFVRYNEANFSWADQERLANAAHKASRRGASVIVSNAYHPEVRKLYPRASARVLNRLSLVSADPAGRRVVREYLFHL